MPLAWFTPWPPQTSGVAACSEELVHALARRGHGIDVFVDERLVPDVRRHADAGPSPSDVRVQSAHDFVWRHRRAQYTTVVYQIGNSRAHDFLWPYLFQFPGISMLHDARLHHARARTLLVPDREATYRQEFAFNQPGVTPDAAELAVHGFDGADHYLWPMLRSVVAASRAVAALSRGVATTLTEMYPTHPIEFVPLGHGRAEPFSAAVRQQSRAEWGIATDAVVFGVFGGLSAEKRLEPIFRSFARTRRREPRAHLLLAGAADPSVDTRELAATLNITDAVTHLGAVGDLDFDRAIAAVDVSLNLRWPSALETSGPWLRALAAGRASIVIDLPHQTHVPALDPRNWQPLHGDASVPAVTVAIDILDEDHSLGLAMDRLASDPALRARLGAEARHYWEREHTIDAMAGACERLFSRVADVPAPAASLPDSLRPDPWRAARECVTEFGELQCELL